MNTQSVIGIYGNMTRAEDAVRALDKGGFPIEQISVVAQDLQSEKQVHGYVTAGDLAKGGAVTGAFMVLGLKYGNSPEKDKNAKANTYQKIEDFTNRFKVCNNSVACRELLGCDISMPEGLKKAKDKGLFAVLCPRLVQSAAEILEEMLNE